MVGKDLVDRKLEPAGTSGAVAGYHVDLCVAVSEDELAEKQWKVHCFAHKLDAEH